MNEDELQQMVDGDPEFEARLAKAMAIEVPELTMPDLPAMEAADVVPLRTRSSAPKWLAGLAIAASIVLAVFLGVRSPGTDYGTLEQQVLEHLDGEPHALRITDEVVPDSQLERVVPASIATMNHNAGLITYAKSCQINGRDVPHLVIQGKRGPVTIMLMPEEMVSETITIEGESIQGVIIPVGDGSIAIIGDKQESLDNIKENVLNSVSWST